MTELNATTATIADLPAEQGQPETPAGTSDTPEADPNAQDHTSERRLRHRAQAAEAERDALAARLEALQAREVTRHLEQVLAVPGDLFELTDTTVDDLTDEETGQVDPDTVAAAAEALLEQRPGLAFVPPNPAPIPGTYSNAGQGREHYRPPADADWRRVLQRR